MKKRVWNKYFVFSVLYWILTGLYIYYYLFSWGSCAMAIADAISQHYPAMVYIRRMWIDFFSALVNGKHYIFPMVDFTIGMGENTISALNYYGLGDPFYILTVLSSEENLPYFYSIFFFFRIYLGGLAFMAFSSELSRAKSNAAYIIGAFVYCFTGFTSLSNAHIIFVHAMFYIPLMMLGAEKSVNNRRKGLLCIAVFCFALSGFYFFYIGSVSLAIYVIYRLIITRNTLKASMLKIGNLILEYLLGLGLSAVIFLPAIVGFLSSNRVESKVTIKPIMSLSEQIHMIKNMFFPSYMPIQALAVCTFAMIMIIYVLSASNRKKEKIILLLLYLSAVIPFVTYAMSGFGALYDRWELVINMYIAFLVVDLFDELTHITAIQKISIGVVFCILFVLGKKQDLFDHHQFRETFRAYGIILLVLLFVIPILVRFGKKTAVRYVLFLVVLCTICGNWKEAGLDRPIESLRERNAVAELIGSDGQPGMFYRIENERGFAEPRLQMNISFLRGYRGTMQYLSIGNKFYLQCIPNWDIGSESYNMYGLDQRSVLETMCAVKYFVVRTEYANIIPYGFEYVKSTEDGEWALYENLNSLPIAYSYENTFDVEAYHEMNGLEKQSVMLHAAAVEEYDGEVPVLAVIDNELIEGEYTFSNESGQDIGGGYLQLNAGDTIILTTQLKKDCENCLLYTGSDLFGAEISIEDGYTKYGIGKTPIIINLGTAQEDRTVGVRFTFSSAAQFSEKDFHIIYHDLSDYSQYIDELKKDTEGRFDVATNHIYGDIDFEKRKILCFSVPYMNGWHASIDGKETMAYIVNDMFIGIEVPEGHHDIELYYITPGIRAGAVVSVISLMISVFYLFYKGKKEKGTNHL